MRPVRAATILILVLCPAAAGAQQSQYLYPVERAELESHVGLQFEYGQPSTGPADPTVHRTVLSIEGQYAVLDLVEIGANLPLLDYSFTTSDDPAPDVHDAQLGDPIIGLKLRTTQSERVRTAAFVNTRLPLHSGAGDRHYATFQAGAAVDLPLPRLDLGGTVEILWFLRTVNEDLGTSGRDVAYLGLSLHAGYRLFGPLWARLALQFYNSIHPDGGLHILGLSPGLCVQLLERLSLEISTRVGATNSGRDLFGGRATLLFAATWRLR